MALPGVLPSRRGRPPRQQTLLTFGGETNLPGFTDPLPSAYTLTSLDASFVNERGVTDPTTYTVSVGQSVPGDQAGDAAGPAQVAVLAMLTGVADGADLPMKRSYIAYGPLVATWVLPNGKLSPTGLSALLAPQNVLITPLFGGLDDYYPVRIGRTVSPAPVRVGLVLDSFTRPFIGKRSSRAFRPTGT